MFVELEAGDGIVGWGEGAPRSYYDESVDDARAELERIASDLSDDAGIGSIDQLDFAHQSAKAALDIALHDIEAKAPRSADGGFSREPLRSRAR